MLILISLISVTAHASIGAISDITGSGVLERNSEVISGENGTSVKSHDTAVTENGRMRIDFIDDTRVDITEHSRLIIDDFVFDPEAGDGSLAIRASLGSVRYASGQIAKRSQQNVKIQTPSATIGVRGTDFAMIVDEIGVSTITLLPSCRLSAVSRSTECYVGEISVETDAGIVVMNQAFETTVVETSNRMPSHPLVLDIDQSRLNNMLIIRNESDYELTARQLEEQADILDVDYLEFDDLDRDLLEQSIDGLWTTELEKAEDILPANVFDEMISFTRFVQSLLADQLDSQFILGDRPDGLDEETGIFFQSPPPNFIVRREDEAGNTVELRLSESHGYSIDILQGPFEIYDYEVGTGRNRIRIDQSR